MALFLFWKLRLFQSCVLEKDMLRIFVLCHDLELLYRWSNRFYITICSSKNSAPCLKKKNRSFSSACSIASSPLQNDDLELAHSWITSCILFHSSLVHLTGVQSRDSQPANPFSKAESGKGCIIDAQIFYKTLSFQSLTR